MIDQRQLSDLVRRVLTEAGLYSPSACALVMGTALAESGLRNIRQVGGGPALGLWQMEPATVDDIWDNYLRHRLELTTRVMFAAGLVVSYSQERKFDRRGFLMALESNLAFGALMCRVHYLRAPGKLPDVDDAEGMADYWKTYYNTAGGKGHPNKFATLYRANFFKWGIE